MALSRFAVAVASFALMAAGMPAKAAEIVVLSSNAVKQVMGDLIPQFERASGHKVSIGYYSSSIILKRLEGGAAADLVILTGEAIDDLSKQGKLVAGSRADLARSGIGVAVRAGAPRPEIRSADDFRKTLLQARSIGYSGAGASGAHFMAVVQRLGIGDQVRGKLVPVEGRPVGEIVAKGEAEIGLQQLSELLPVAGIDIVGPLPGDLQKMTVFSAALLPSAREPEAAKALVRVVASPGSEAIIRKRGMEPALRY
jgi:molybdate transport system substrate-binding protein